MLRVLPSLLMKSSRLLSSSRDYSSSDSRSPSWKLPSSVTSSSRSYDRPWAESSISSRNKLVLKLHSVICLKQAKYSLVLNIFRVGVREILLNDHWNVFFNVCLYFPRLILRGGWGCAPVCWTPPTMAILKGPNCHTATEDCTQERPAPQLQDPPIPVLGLAVAEVHLEMLKSYYSDMYFVILVNSLSMDGWAISKIRFFLPCCWLISSWS